MKARDVADQYMFGPALLVSPVTAYKARSRQVYLPAGATWYNFWTGALGTGGQTVAVDAPYDQIPLFARAGSIVPFGPEQQYIGEKDARAADALCLRRRERTVLALRRRRRDLRVREAAVLADPDRAGTTPPGHSPSAAARAPSTAC